MSTVDQLLDMEPHASAGEAGTLAPAEMTRVQLMFQARQLLSRKESTSKEESSMDPVKEIADLKARRIAPEKQIANIENALAQPGRDKEERTVMRQNFGQITTRVIEKQIFWLQRLPPPETSGAKPTTNHSSTQSDSESSASAHPKEESTMDPVKEIAGLEADVKSSRAPAGTSSTIGRRSISEI